MLVHRMVRDIKDSKVLRKVRTKDEANRLESLKRQLAQAKQTGGDKDYERELEEEIKELEAQYQRTGLTKDGLTKDGLIKDYDYKGMKITLYKDRDRWIWQLEGKSGTGYGRGEYSDKEGAKFDAEFEADKIMKGNQYKKIENKDSDYRGYKVTDQIIKGFLIYKSGKGPATFFAKNENGKEFEGSMEEIKKQIDAYWVKQDEDVMKQKVRDYQMASGQTLSKPGWYLVDGNDRPVDGPYPESVAKKKAEELGQDATYFSEYDIKRMSSDSKTKDEELQPNQKIAVTKLINFKGNKAQYKNGNRIYEVEKDKTGAWHLTGEYEYTGDKKTKDVGGFIGVATTKAGKYFTGYKKQEKSPRFDTEEKANEWCRFRMQRSDAKYIAKCEVVPTNDSKTKDKAYHPRWHIKDDKLFRLRSAIKKAKTKDVELSNRAVWRKEDFDKMVAAGNFTIVSKQPWGYEVKVKSGNIYGVEIKDTYTKGSADKKTKDQINPEYIRKRKILVDQLERAKKNRAPVETVENITDMIKKLDEDYDRGSAKDKYTGDPLTKKGQKIMSAMKEKYGKKKGESVFYASKNKGTISGVDGKTRDYRQPKTVKYKGFEIDPYFGQFSDGDIGDETYLIYKNNKLVVSKEFYTVEEAKAYIDKKYK